MNGIFSDYRYQRFKTLVEWRNNGEINPNIVPVKCSIDKNLQVDLENSSSNLCRIKSNEFNETSFGY